MREPVEYWDVYDKSGKYTGRAKAKGAQWLPGEFHPAMEAWIVNSRGEILIQRRADTCDILPGVWGLTTGRMVAGESTQAGCLREMKEELGLTVQRNALTFLRRIFRTDLIWDLYLVQTDAPLNTLTLQKSEVSEARWVCPADFQSMLADGSLFYYPEILEILEQVKQCINSY